MDIDAVISDILRKLYNMNIQTFIKGSYGYGVPHARSDIDIQIEIEDKESLGILANCLDAKLEQILFQDSTGNCYTSYLIGFNRQGYRVDLIYDDDPNAFDRVQEIIGEINELSLADKYILRLVSGPYKYDRIDAHRIFLAIFDRYKCTLDKELLKRIESGQQIEEELAHTIRMVVQILYTNEVGSNYRRVFLA